MSNKEFVILWLIFWSIAALVSGIFLLCYEEGAREKLPELVPPVVVIDGCEYFKCANHHSGFVYTHKGNCTNHIFRP